MPGYAVIDFETTGFSPKKGDRVVEVGVVLLDSQGFVEGTWDSIINPLRDVGPTRIHGLTATDVSKAPTFDQIAGELAALLSNRVLVAHNASFDLRFLLNEFERLGCRLSQEEVPYLCTMMLASFFIPGGSRSLQACCEALDIDHTNSHEALSDALSTGNLLRSYLEQAPEHRVWPAAQIAAEQFEIDYGFEVSTGQAVSRHSSGQQFERVSILESRVEKLEAIDGDETEVAFFGLLDAALVDGDLDQQERFEIVDFARDRGLSSEQIQTLEGKYFDSVVRSAWLDGELSSVERAGIFAVGRFMSVPEDEIERALDEDFVLALSGDQSAEEEFKLELHQGDVVALTGEMDKPRQHYEDLIWQHGLVPSLAVSKKVRVVVAADPMTLSGKARKARSYGIPVISVEEFVIALSRSQAG